MSNIFLTRVDSPEENDINLSKGEVCVGRGSILGCDDKRISRNHGLLQIYDNHSITLVSLHSNPCFYKVENLDSYTVLMKGQSKILRNGDEFALLPNSFQYRIVVKADVGFVPPIDTPEGSEVNKDKNKTATNVTRDHEHDTAHIGNDVESTMPDSESGTPSKRKRMLPSWLTSLSGNEPTSSIATACSPSSTTTSTSRKRKASTAEVKTEIKEEPLDLGMSLTASNDNEPSAPVTSNQHELSDEEDNKVKPSVGQGKDGYEAEYGQASSTTTGTPNRDTGQNATSSSSREPCVYGATCYRKNPQHRIDFSHPGDADFNVSPSLPECPYGTSCYRKNLQHCKDFKHSQPPPAMPTHVPQSPPQFNGNSPTTRTRRRASVKDGDGSEDDYDYDDPFLNDASSDDYQPTSSEDSDMDEDDGDDAESQERKRMLREAKKFTRNKKK